MALMSKATAQQPEGNRLLASIPADEYARLLPELETVSFGNGDVLAEPETPMAWVYFPKSLIASVIVQFGQQMVESSTPGREGFVGIPALLGMRSVTTTVVQIPGDAYRIPTRDFLELLPKLPGLAHALRLYALTVMDEAAQSAGCNRAHAIEKRCARFLLLIHDRMQRDQFPITHKYLATMLGVRRAGVTIAAGTLQKSGIIRYTRGKMTILDRPALEKASCRCYETISGNRDRMVPSTPMPELA